MRTSPLSVSAAAVAVLAAAFSIAAQAPQPQEPPAGAPPNAPGRPPREFPAPTNLKVLPKTLTGKQVRDVMEQWQGELGVHCNTCHTAIPGKVGPNGRPQLDFPNDSKPEKSAARLMFTMTQKINDDYVSMVDMDHDDHGEAHENHEDHKVTCGTCHRGHQHPEAYIPPPEHEGPRPPAPIGPAPR